MNRDKTHSKLDHIFDTKQLTVSRLNMSVDEKDPSKIRIADIDTSSEISVEDNTKHAIVPTGTISPISKANSKK